MVERKGVGYIIEAMAALMVVFLFVLGNNPRNPQNDISRAQKEIIAEDVSITLKKSGDIDSFLKNGGTGTLKTAAQQISRERVELSGTVENLPITRVKLGFHTLPKDRENISMQSVGSLGDTCHNNNDLKEIEEDDGDILRTVNPRYPDIHLYVADTDPGVQGGNGNLDYDTLYVDNGTRCQFSSAEGPYYIEEVFYWGEGGSGFHYEINNLYENSQPLEIYNATQVVDLRGTLRERVNGIRTDVRVENVAVDLEKLEDIDTLIFRERGSLTTLDNYEGKIQQYASSGNLFLMIDLKKSDFFQSNTPEENIITDSGLKWVGMSYENRPKKFESSFTDSDVSKEVQTFFKGLNPVGGISSVNLKPGGNITSSNSRYFKSQQPLLANKSFGYNISDRNATNYSMDQVKPVNVNGIPDTACVDETGTKKSSNLTRGVFRFYDYQKDSFKKYREINTELGRTKTLCKKKDPRAINIDLNGNSDYSDEGEGPYLNGELLKIENRSYRIHFPTKKSFKTGKKAVMVYSGDDSIEIVNYRKTFRDFDGRRLIRMEYRKDYGPEGEKLIASLIYSISDRTKSFGGNQRTVINSGLVGGITGSTFIPYEVDMRWN